MPETEEIVKEVAPKKDMFDDANWSETEPVIVEKVAAPIVETKPTVEEKPIIKEDEELVDPDEYLSSQTGWKNWDEAKAAKQELADLKAAKEKNQISFEEGNEDEVYNYLSEKKRLDRIEKMDISKADQAAEIIKASLQYKHKELSPSEIDRMFSRRYQMPAKPIQQEGQEDAEYVQSVKEWESQVKDVESDMVIDAKIARPELVQQKANLARPNIPDKTEAVAETKPSQESLDALKAARDRFLSNLESSYKDFDGFATKVKDESVEIPISFKAPDEDKAVIKELMKEFNPDAYFQKRWVNADGSVNVLNMAKDLYSLEFGDKVNQGIANNAASERLNQFRKEKSNIKLDGSSTQSVEIEKPKTERQKEVEAIWEA